MNEHLQDLRAGGRSMKKWEIEMQQKDNEIERLNELVKGLREERDYLFNKTTSESNYEIERLNNIINKTSKRLEFILNCIKDYIVKKEEYIKIHTDYIYALEEQIEKLKGVDKE